MLTICYHFLLFNINKLIDLHCARRTVHSPQRETSCMVMGISLGVIPLYVHDTLKFSNVITGLVIGLQYAATLLTRHLAGKMADTKGGKKAVILGIILSACSGLFCLLSYWMHTIPIYSVISLSLGRILLGIGESYLVIGIFAWGFSLVGSKNIGKVMVWNGMGMYGGMACGAPLGIWLSLSFSLPIAFAGIMPGRNSTGITSKTHTSTIFKYSIGKSPKMRT